MFIYEGVGSCITDISLYIEMWSYCLMEDLLLSLTP